MGVGGGGRGEGEGVMPREVGSQDWSQMEHAEVAWLGSSFKLVMADGC